MNGMNHPDESERTPRDLVEIQGAVDRLAKAERGSASAGFEDRVFAASRAALAAPAPIRFPAAGRWRLAAAMALIAGAGLFVSAWVTMRGGSATIIVSPGPLVENTPAVEEALDADALRGELEDLLASYDAVEQADLADSTPMSETFWDDDDAPMKEDPIR